jgi:hypothetical protein
MSQVAHTNTPRSAAGANGSRHLPKIAVPPKTLRGTSNRPRSKGSPVARPLEHAVGLPDVDSSPVRSSLPRDASNLPPITPALIRAGKTTRTEKVFESSNASFRYRKTSFTKIPCCSFVALPAPETHLRILKQIIKQKRPCRFYGPRTAASEAGGLR